jgi:hypothetical protein
MEARTVRYDHTICFLAALALVLSMAPASMASHHAGPPDETGLGAADVSDEPNTPADEPAGEDSSTNGLDPCDPGCTGDASGTLILEGAYTNGQYPYFVDLNNIVRQGTENAPAIDHEEFMYPGEAFLSAWWGWWVDKGRGGNLQETDQSVPGVLSDEPDGVVNDGHDNHADNSDTIYTGAWDEFVWRGENPWAGQSDWDAQLGGKPSKPGDQMFAFVHPGTHDTGVDSDGLLENNADDAQRPDFNMDDRTSQAPSSPGPYPHNNQGYGWLSEGGWWHYQYDSSLLISTTITYSANPDTASGSSELYLPDTGDRVDTDAYSALHPALETAYRTAVYDPGDQQDSPTDPVHEEGLKQQVKQTYSRSDVLTAQALDAYYSATGPASPAVGAADDTAFKPWPHEPTDDGDQYPNASFDDDKSYGMLAGDSNDYYENPDRDSDYSAHETAYQPWLDAQTQVALAQYLIQVRGYYSANAFPTPNGGDAADRTATPSAIWISANLGAWQDHDGDEFIGNLSELGRPTSEEDPYANGGVDDPNDYGDTPTATQTSPDEIKSTPAEWRGAGAGAKAVQATLEPVGTPTNAAGEHAWGSTNPPVGAYVVRDTDSNQYNPYEDSVEDACGCGAGVGDLQGDDDGEQLSQYVQYGPIEVSFSPNTQGNSGGFLMEENVVLPTGSLDFPVKITVEGELDGSKFANLGDGQDLRSQTVTDVDYLEPVSVAN